MRSPARISCCFLSTRSLAPLALGAILTARAVGGIAFATAFGSWVDRRTSIAPLLLALAGSSIGYGLLGLTTDFALLFVIAAVPAAIGAAAFSQSIALVKRNFDHANVRTVDRAIGVMRASWSLAWAIGPAIGAAVVVLFGFRGGVFRERRVRRDRPGDAGAGARETGSSAPRNPRDPNSLERRLRGRARLRGPRPVSHRAVHGIDPASHRPHYDAGRSEERCRPGVQPLCGAGNRGHGRAHLEAAQARPAHGDRAGFVAFVAYFVVLALAQSVAAVLWAQILRAIAIALVTYLGIGFLHSLMPHRAGAAAALFSNAGQVGSVLSALGAGLLAQAFGYTSIFAACAVLSAAGLWSDLARADRGWLERRRTQVASAGASAKVRFVENVVLPYFMAISIRLGPLRASAAATAAPIASRSSARAAGTPIDAESA